MWPSSGQWPTRASPWRGTMVYWHDDTGAATAGKHKSDVCSEISTVRDLHRCRDQSFEWLQRLEELWAALTLFGPIPPKAEGDEGDNDEDEGSQDNTNYEVGEVTRPRHKSRVSLPVIWGLWWNGSRMIRTSWGDKRWKDVLKRHPRFFAASWYTARYQPESQV